MRNRTPLNRGLATRRSLGLVLAVCVLCTGAVARAVEVRVPAAGAELTWMPVSIEIAFDASADTGTLSVLLNGNDISSAFAFGPPSGGEVVAAAADVWDGFVILGSNQIDVSIEIGATPVVVGSSFDTLGDPFADEVASYTQGTNGGYNADLLPGVAIGPPARDPADSGLLVGSLDVVSLGRAGSIVLRFADNVIVDGPGVDFTVFENAFMLTGGDGYTDPPFAEPGRVKVSQNGSDWAEFPCTLTSAAGPYWPGCAGVYPTFSNLDLAPTPHPSTPTTTPIENLVDQNTFPDSPPPPAGSGGDSFDLADVGLAWVRYVKIESTTFEARSASLGQSGPDIDAVVAVHSSPEEPPAIRVPALSPAGLLSTFLLFGALARARLGRAGRAP